MAVALIDINGYIKQTYTKPSPYLRLNPGERYVRYDYPDVDLELYNITPIEPISKTATEITFSVSLKPDADSILINKNIKLVDSDVDNIYALVIGNRATEYAKAEEDAKSYAAAGYTGTVPTYVQNWADSAGYTAQQAADSILAQASAWRSLASSLRENRLKTKAAIRAGQSETAMPEWNAYIDNIKKGL